MIPAVPDILDRQVRIPWSDPPGWESMGWTPGVKLPFQTSAEPCRHLPPQIAYLLEAVGEDKKIVNIQGNKADDNFSNLEEDILVMLGSSIAHGEKKVSGFLVPFS